MRHTDRTILQNLKAKRIRVDFETGTVFGVKGQPLRPTLHNGYACVSLTDLEQHKTRKVYVHRVIWLAKHGGRRAGKSVTHLQPPDTDNRLANLAQGRRRPKQMRFLTKRQVANIRRSTRQTQVALAAKYGVTQAAIYLIKAKAA